MEKEINEKIYKQVLLSARMIRCIFTMQIVERALKKMMECNSFLFSIKHTRGMKREQRNQLLIAIKILNKDGVKTIWDLKKLTPEEILKYKGIGKRRLALIEEFINSY